MAIMAAMGVAAAQGMWHRARHRQAMADRSRANADKAQGKAAGASAGTSRHGGSGGGGRSRKSDGGLLTGSRHEAPGRNRHRSRHGGGHGGAKGDRHTRPRKEPKNPHKRPTGGKDGGKAPKPATRRTRGSRKAGRGTTRPRLKNRKPANKVPKVTKNGKRQGPGKNTPAPKPGAVRWKAPRKSRPGPGGDKALPAGRKRWKRPAGVGTPGGKHAKGHRKGKRSSKRRTWARWTSSPAWVKRWRTRHKAASSTSSANTTGPTTSTGSPQPGGQTGRQSWTRATPPPPPPGWEKMRPPPGADQSVRVESCERVANPPRPRQESPILAGAPAAGRAALPPAAARSTTTKSQTTGGQMSPRGSLVPAPRASVSTQYADADLTILDVIEADADMAEEITEGVDEARATADGCEQLMTRLEVLHAKVVELRVPGVLEGMVARLMDMTATVKAKAEAIAAGLPGASEAISTAGSNAAARHKPLADAVRDAGHIRPAERDYHND